MTRALGRWKLPQPTDIKEDNEWVAIPKISRTIPFGYEVDAKDNGILNPIPDQLDKLEIAKRYLKQYSYREVSQWLTRNTGRYISHVGLRKRLENEKRRNNKAASLRRWADYAKEAIAKAEKIEKEKKVAEKEEAAKEATPSKKN